MFQSANLSFGKKHTQHIFTEAGTENNSGISLTTFLASRIQTLWPPPRTFLWLVRSQLKGNNVSSGSCPNNWNHRVQFSAGVPQESDKGLHIHRCWGTEEREEEMVRIVIQNVIKWTGWSLKKECYPQEK